MKLIDTSAWIEYYREKGNVDYKDVIIQSFKDNTAAICGLIKTELLVFTKSKREFNILESDLSGVHWLKTDLNVYTKSSDIGFNLRRKGITIPAIDLVIASCALIYNAELIHFDKHYNQIKAYYPLKTISFSNSR